jgi:general secretion pathway protein A
MTDPFSTSPSPGFLYQTQGIKAALHKTRYAIDRRQGLTAILGDVGMGKSSLVRLLYGDYAAKDDMVVSFMPTPSATSEFAFLKEITGDFGLAPKRSYQAQEVELREFLLAQYGEGKNVAVFIDEAQRLKNPMLEIVRAMLNYETNTAKLIQIVLAGQIELRDRLLDPSQKAIRSRIFAPSVLAPLTLGETKAMLDFRCQQVEIPLPFSDDAIQVIYDATGGVPREILKVAAIAFELARMNGFATVETEVAEMATREAVLQ